MFFRSRSSGVSWLVVCLGNPGPKYAMTRHNVGFLTAEVLEKTAGAAATRLRFQALTAQCSLGGERVLLMKPQTYMNLSGDAVAPAAAFYKIPPERVLVVSDDVSLPLGKLRIRRNGSAGGHNGLKSIIARLGTDAFPRVKIGVGAPPHPDYDMADWVLGVFRGQDAMEIRAACEKAAEAVECCIRSGIDAAMNRYN
jgi:PTH1 family peptidyl-tRNA hydrolase